MTIEDLIASGAVKDQATGGSAAVGAGPKVRSLTVARTLTPEEQKVWEKYKDDLRMGKQP